MVYPFCIPRAIAFCHRSKATVLNLRTVFRTQSHTGTDHDSKESRTLPGMPNPAEKKEVGHCSFRSLPSGRIFTQSEGNLIAYRSCFHMSFHVFCIANTDQP